MASFRVKIKMWIRVMVRVSHRVTVFIMVSSSVRPKARVMVTVRGIIIAKPIGLGS
jgi:hypothetical protein